MDYYKVLGVNPNSSQGEIKKAFRQLSLKHHPDRGGDAEEFKKINEAYHVLIDEDEREKYDQFGSEYIPRKAPQWQASTVWTNNTWDYIR